MQTIETDLAETAREDGSPPGTILCEEILSIQPSLYKLGIGFSVSHADREWRNGKLRKPPYFCCRYNAGGLGNVNIVAYYYPLLGDWELMENDVEWYRRRIRSAIREEMIHAVQIITIKEKYAHSFWAQCRYQTAQAFYEHLLGNICDELTATIEGTGAVLTAAQLYYEDWTITSMESLRETDRKLHERDEYFAIELIRQLVQIRLGDLTSEEAKGNAWDRHRIFRVGNFGTTQSLLQSMANNLREAAPYLARLSPMLAEVLSDIEKTIVGDPNPDPAWL